MKSLTFITGNINKFKEVNLLIEKKGLNVKLEHKKIPAVEIQSDSLEEVARHKVRSVIGKINGNFFLEDAGFFVKALNGFPGVYSRYVYDTIGYEGILKLMRGETDRRAAFRAVAALYLAERDEILLFTGEVTGKVAEKAAGSYGFGFDPIFIPDEVPDRTFAQLRAEEKNRISHRARAVGKMLDYLQNEFNFSS